MAHVTATPMMPVRMPMKNVSTHRLKARDLPDVQKWLWSRNARWFCFREVHGTPGSRRCYHTCCTHVCLTHEMHHEILPVDCFLMYARCSSLPPHMRPPHPALLLCHARCSQGPMLLSHTYSIANIYNICLPCKCSSLTHLMRPPHLALLRLVRVRVREGLAVVHPGRLQSNRNTAALSVPRT